MSTKLSRPRICGEYGEFYNYPDLAGPFVRLTTAGRQALADWLDKHPRPIALLRHCWPKLYHDCRRQRLTNDEINAAALDGLVRGFIRYESGRSAIGTMLAWAVRGAVSDMLVKHSRHSCEYSVSDAWATGVTNMISQEPEARPEPDHDAADTVLRLLERANLTAKEQTALDARMDGHNLRDVGVMMGVSKERVRQLETLALTKIRARNSIVTSSDRAEAQAAAYMECEVLRALAKGTQTFPGLCKVIRATRNATSQAVRSLTRRGDVEKFWGKGQQTRLRLVRKAVCV